MTNDLHTIVPVYRHANVTPTVQLDPSQQLAYDRVQEWLEKKDTPTLSIGGLAGSGKSTLIKHLIGPGTAVVAFTGKAVNVLQSKGIDAVTMHKLLYDFLFEVKGSPKFIAKPIGALADLNITLVIVDEASMVSSSLAHDLLKHAISVLFVGDHGQLPPVGGGTTSFVQDPDLVLEHIHRQAEGSAIIDFAMHMREGKNPFHFKSNEEVTVLHASEITDAHYEEADVVLVGENFKRTEINNKRRKSDVPFPGEPLVILRNNYEKGVFNGQIVHVVSTTKIVGNKIWIRVDDGMREFEAPFWLQQFGQAEAIEVSDYRSALLADYGYALTVHKSQGSQMDHVLVIEGTPHDKRWHYTAATRAIKKLVYVPAGSDWSTSTNPLVHKLLAREKAKPMPKFSVNVLDMLRDRIALNKGNGNGDDDQ